MKLSKSNMIYRFITRYGIRPSTNLCNLFWQTVFMVAGLTVAGFLIGLYLMGAVMTFPGILHPASVLFVFLSFVGAIVGIGAGICWLGSRGKLASIEKFGDAMADIHDAIKEKYCPIINWKD